MKVEWWRAPSHPQQVFLYLPAVQLSRLTKTRFLFPSSQSCASGFCLGTEWRVWLSGPHPNQFSSPARRLRLVHSEHRSQSPGTMGHTYALTARQPLLGTIETTNGFFPTNKLRPLLHTSAALVLPYLRTMQGQIVKTIWLGQLPLHLSGARLRPHPIWETTKPHN